MGKKKNKRGLNKKGTLAFTQIFLLVISIVAIAYIVGSEAKLVRGAQGSTAKVITTPTAGVFGFKHGQSLSEIWNGLTPQRQSEWNTKAASQNYQSGFEYFKATQVANPDITGITSESTPSWLNQYNSGELQGVPDMKIIVTPPELVPPPTPPAPATNPTPASTNTPPPKPSPAPPPVPEPKRERADPPSPPDAGAVGEPATRTKTDDLSALKTSREGAKKTAVAAGTAVAAKKIAAKTAGAAFVDALTWAGGALLIASLVGALLVGMGKITPTQASNLATAAGLGTLIGRFIISKELFGAAASGPIGWAIGIAIAVWVYALLFDDKTQKPVTFECLPWQAPVGGKNCEECNKQGFPCSEYQCRSLGQGCELLNQGTSEEICAFVNRNDVEPPVIRTWEDALLFGYEYAPDETISPPDRGVKIINTNSPDGCVPAFTPLTFGINTNEPAACKIDVAGKNTYDEMNYFFGGTPLSKYNHTQTMSLPGPKNLESEGIEMPGGGEVGLFVRCRDANGNSNVANFVFRFCVQPGPDTTPPLIDSTSIPNEMPVAYNQSSVEMQLFVNEPAECKWSHRDQSYDKMEEMMKCSLKTIEMNARMLYSCSTTLTGLKDRFDNEFYFRCKDQPNAQASDRNVNEESYKLTIKGTQPLVIDSVSPNGTTVKDSTDVVKVTLNARTSAGYDEGKAVCYFSETGEDKDYVAFFNTNSYQHSQDLWLLGDLSYTYYIKCIDLGGNADYKTINFDVESDTESPIVVRAYKEERYLKIITNEEASCVYDVVDCSYPLEDGIKMTAINKVNHFTDWKTSSDFYIKCKDAYGNQPAPNQCSIIIRAIDS